MYHGGKKFGVGGENSFTSKRSEKSQPLDLINSLTWEKTFTLNIAIITVVQVQQIIYELFNSDKKKYDKFYYYSYKNSYAYNIKNLIYLMYKYRDNSSLILIILF